MQVKTNYTFTALLESVRFNMVTTAVFLPHHIIIELPKGRLRVSGNMNGAPFSLAIQYRKDGSRYFSVSADLRRAARIEPGDTVKVSFRILELYKVEMPQELENKLNADEDAKKIWKSYTPGAKRVLAQYVDAVRNIDSRMKRAIEIVRRAKSGLLQPQQNKKNKNK